MIDVHHAFERRDLSTNSPLRAVQQTSQLISCNDNPVSTAIKLIHDVLGLNVSFTDARQARIVAMGVVESLVKSNLLCDEAEDVFAMAQQRASAFISLPQNQWMWADEQAIEQAGNVCTVVEGIDTKVGVNANGTIKKGGRQVIVAEMYKKHVIGKIPPMTNQEFVQLLMKELGMSKAGATTYAYAVKKELGEPEGGIVKAKKGRKAKTVV